MANELNIRKDLRELAEAALLGWGDELTAQGHKLTGKLIRSLDYKIKRSLKGWDIEFFIESYGLILDRGTKPGKIPYSPGRGRAAKSKFIEALVRYVKRRMRIGGKKGLGIAFAIARTQKKEGMPTRRSFRYSRNNERRNWIDRGFNKQAKELERLLDKIVGKRVDLLISSIFEEGTRAA